MGHVVLLGDSIFDNGAYVPGEPDVVRPVQARLPQDWRASLRAVDGAVTLDVARQLPRIPRDATHLVVSVGGNDALRRSRVMQQRVFLVADALTQLASEREGFAHDYGAMLEGVMALGLPVALCTIYDPRFPDPGRRRVAVVALAAFNDVITREAFARRLALVDLRLICNEPDDYANPIEPSAKGGAKIAAVIAQVVAGNTIFPRSQVFAK